MAAKGTEAKAKVAAKLAEADCWTRMFMFII